MFARNLLRGLMVLFGTSLLTFQTGLCSIIEEPFIAGSYSLWIGNSSEGYAFNLGVPFYTVRGSMEKTIVESGFLYEHDPNNPDSYDPNAWHLWDGEVTLLGEAGLSFYVDHWTFGVHSRAAMRYQGFPELTPGWDAIYYAPVPWWPNGPAASAIDLRVFDEVTFLARNGQPLSQAELGKYGKLKFYYEYEGRVSVTPGWSGWTEGGGSYNFSFYAGVGSIVEVPVISEKEYGGTVGIEVEVNEHGVVTYGLGFRGFSNATMGVFDYDFSHTARLGAIEFEDRTTPEDHGLTLQFKSGAPSPNTESIIPEPSTFIIWSLLGALTLTVGWWRRRR